jgi:hypothetical protein
MSINTDGWIVAEIGKQYKYQGNKKVNSEVYIWEVTNLDNEIKLKAISNNCINKTGHASNASCGKLDPQYWTLIEEQAIIPQVQEIKAKQQWEVVHTSICFTNNGWSVGQKFTITFVETDSVYGRREGKREVFLGTKEDLLKSCKYIRDIPDFKSMDQVFEEGKKLGVVHTVSINQHDFSNPYLVVKPTRGSKFKACLYCLEPEGTHRACDHDKFGLKDQTKEQIMAFHERRFANLTEGADNHYVDKSKAIQSLGGSLGYQRVSGVDALVDSGWNTRPEKK